MSQSELKLLQHSPDKFFSPRREGPRKSYFSLGTAVDTALTDGLEALEDRVILLDSMPSGKIYGIAEWLVDNGLQDIDENILAAREAVNYNSTLLPPTVIRHYREQAEWYYSILSTAEGKILLTEDDAHKVKRIYTSLTTNKYTAHIFEKKEHEIFVDHAIIYYTYKGVECKAEIDRLKFDLSNMTVTPYDFKTMGESTRMFATSVKKYRYDIQAASYTLAVDCLITSHKLNNETAHSPNIDFDISGFRIMPFTFVVETTDNERIGIAPMVYRCSSELLRAGMWGVYPDKKNSVNGPAPNILFKSYNLIPGFDALIDEYLFLISLPENERNYTSSEHEELTSTGAISLSVW
ncbi:MAG TPA: hypothetical protein PKD00_09575 [Burkholderiales bacterium]|nr:hypothetical protein [Burkholderiales bacterium]